MVSLRTTVTWASLSDHIVNLSGDVDVEKKSGNCQRLETDGDLHRCGGFARGRVYTRSGRYDGGLWSALVDKPRPDRGQNERCE